MQPLKGHSRGSVHSAGHIEIARADIVSVPDPNQPQCGSLSVVIHALDYRSGNETRANDDITFIAQ